VLSSYFLGENEVQLLAKIVFNSKILKNEEVLLELSSLGMRRTEAGVTIPSSPIPSSPRCGRGRTETSARVYISYSISCST